MNTQDLSLALQMDSTLGEGIGWFDGRWWWTDIQRKRLHVWDGVAAAPLTAHLPDRLGSFVHTRSGRMVLGLAKSIVLATQPDAEGRIEILQTLAEFEPELDGNRSNDGRTDRAGNYVFGTIHDVEDKRAIASLYQYSSRHGLRRLNLPHVAIANSICFSPDGRTMYFADTLDCRIRQADYDAERAELSNIRTFVEVTTPHGWPDGAVIDRQGCLWNAQWGAGAVVQYSPEGQVMRTLHLAGPHSSCPAFGGANGDQLMVTTARQELSEADLAAWPLSGSLFTLQMDEPLSLPDVLFDDGPL
ncbi:SMP-30/gluconolactonase/LRE family protein [Paucibacter sp. R3-3]|uniref:SMP-30/gluconolactonase/LRE family protein n=1 Tax=Roseateles agri TaxID=3098619 RepID=A0ABU5DL12_9BURK|nr:SMP-30/gluconolactonase/LRE family protein [Paucibacter sp. R3-3]MDY0746996.1 SMP-30/gluconolactonase/LRE family protein [Paucibacter sp. R3-3]